MSRNKLLLTAVLSLLVIIVSWALFLPAVSNKTANEKLSDIIGPATKSKVIAANPTTQSEMSSADTLPKVEELFTGSLSGMNRQSSEGDVTIVRVDGKTYVRLEDNFTVTNGPDLLVGLGNDGRVQELIGDLKANSGGQNYLIPDDININEFSQIFIHCRAFKYSFASADLQKL